MIKFENIYSDVVKNKITNFSHNKTPFLLALILIIAFLIKLQNIFFSKVFIYKGDEIYWINASFKIILNHFNPGIFYHGSLYFYIVSFLYSCLFVFGKILGWFTNDIDLVVFFLANSGIFYSIARMTSAIFNIATIYIVFTLGTYLWNKKTGLLAAFAFTIIPMVVRTSISASMYSTTTFLIVLSAFYGLQLIKKCELRDIVKASLVFGLAVSSDYYALLLLPFYVTVFLNLNKKKEKTSLLPLAIFIFSAIPVSIFIMTNPSCMLHPALFRQDILGQIHTAAYSSEFGLTHNALFYVWLLLKPPYLFLTVFFSTGTCLFIKRRRMQEIAIISFPLFNILLFSFSKIQLNRYIIHAMPFLALVAAGTAAIILRRKKWNRTKAILILTYTFFCLYGFVPGPHNETAYVTAAKEWFQNNVPKKSVVLINPGTVPFAALNLDQITQNKELYCSVLNQYLKLHPEEDYKIWIFNLQKESIRLIKDNKISYLILPDRDYDQTGKDWLTQNAVLLKGFGRKKDMSWRIRIYKVL